MIENEKPSVIGETITISRNALRDKNVTADRIVQCLNAMHEISSPERHRQTWDAIKHLKLDAYHEIKSKYDKAVKVLKAAAIEWQNMAYAAGEEGLLAEDTNFQAMISAILETKHGEKWVIKHIKIN